MDFKAHLMTFLITFALLAGSAQAESRPVKLVALGDSLTAGYQLPAEDAVPARLQEALLAAGEQVIIDNAGVSGDTSADGLARVDWSVPDGTDGVILELGANDALRGLSPDETAKNLDAIITGLKARGIDVMLCGILAPPNMGSEYEAAFNPIYPELARRHGLVFHPFFLDGVALDATLKLDDNMHPNAAGTKVIARNLTPKAIEFIKKIRAEKGIN